MFTSGYTLSYPGSRDALADWIEALPANIPFVFDPTPVVADIPRAILDACACPHHLAELQHDGSGRDRRLRRCRGTRRSAAFRPLPEGRRRRHPRRRARVASCGWPTADADVFPASRSMPSTPMAPATPISAPSSARCRAACRPFEAARYANAAAAHFGHPARRIVGADRRGNPDIPQPCTIDRRPRMAGSKRPNKPCQAGKQ